MKRLASASLALIGLAFATGATAADLGWATSWGASPQAPTAASGPFPGSPTFHDQTTRQVVRISGGGRQVRIRFTNEYGTAPLTIGAAHVALAAPAGGAIQPGSDHVLTFGGKPTATIPAGAPLLSDPVDFAVPALSKLSISLYLPGQVAACTCHGTSVETGYVVPGDVTAAQALPPGAAPLPVRALVSAVEVASDAPKGIVTFGDSITDGVGSTLDADRRWPDQFVERLLKRGGRAVYVSNQGISGNRVLNDGFGVAALARFDRDVLATPGLAYVVVFEGINDIGISFMPRDAGGPLADFMKTFAGAPVSADDIISGYKQMIARAHAHGVKIYGATITPYEGAATFQPAGEQARQAVNTWIRTSKAFDAVLDFDAVWRDPAKPSQIRDGFHMGDHLHGSDAGYKALADSIDLSLFR
jgi:lysophospholipase L1-like esterase